MIEMNRSKLLESIQNGYNLFKELLSELDEEQMTQPGVIGKWSVKDTLAHIVIHEQRMIRWTREMLRGEHPVIHHLVGSPGAGRTLLARAFVSHNLKQLGGT